MEVEITCSHFDHNQKKVVDFCNRVTFDDSLVMDFRKFYDVLKEFYPKSTFITFNVPTK